MLDPKLFRTDIEKTAELLALRGYPLDTATLSNLEATRKEIQVKTQDLQSQRNTRSKSIGQAKARGEDIQPLLAEVSQLGDELEAAKEEQNDVLKQILINSSYKVYSYVSRPVCEILI